MTDFAHIIDIPHEPITIDRQVVAASCDVPQLTAWFIALNDQASHTGEFLRAYREAEVNDEDYFERTAGKLAFLRIACRWVEHRLIELGAYVPYSPADPRAKQLRILLEKVEKLTARLAKLEKSA